MDQQQIRKDILNRLKTIKGHIQGIEKMIEEEKACDDVLLQIAAVKSSLEKVGSIIVEDHAKECLLRENITRDEVDKILKTIMKFSK
ncbi:metal-sensitive transcriptional regulator [Natronincola ferrireducens]|uniref:DNA-binding transcriptional regulator, FrmR family n=1 Tax=Natronincola ferrireducens TaxID=393762 RepID=A0A1G8YIB4_9FIRM|nr:metal-sensitive transcriptional regulator [Natronincola ferrireducens]SDK02572.1 DNA-binding transcriptional regulator, FrmR family [Natronincola ferrireducens]